MIHIKELLRLQNIHRLRLIAGQDGVERTVTEAEMKAGLECIMETKE